MAVWLHISSPPHSATFASMMGPTQFIDIGMAWIFTFFTGTSASASAMASVFASAAGAKSLPPCFEPSYGAQPKTGSQVTAKHAAPGPSWFHRATTLTGSFSAVRTPASAGLLFIQPMPNLSALVTCERTMGHAQGLG